MDSNSSAGVVDLVIHERRERVFLVFAGVFLGSMAMLNIIGITKFIHIGPLQLAVGVLPYPLTFLCTDFISEFYGRERANFVVWLGLALNIFIIFILWLGNTIPAIPFKTDLQRIEQVRHVTVMDPAADGAEAARDSRGMPLEEPAVRMPDGSLKPVTDPRLRPAVDAQSGQPLVNPNTHQPVMELYDAGTDQPIVDEDHLFTRIFLSTRTAVLASMLAYLAAQFCDVFLFHFWKRLTRGKHLWLRNNGSTMISQMVDTVMVVCITFGGSVLAGRQTVGWLLTVIGGSYLFKFVIAALDTIPFYIGVRYLSRYLKIDPAREHSGDAVLGGEVAQPAAEPA
ncbi:MAG: hypothetical protein BIFFINMI_00091 [Phycisphaerae bacterium]|nr:hypothetical protein [Phycisphaerae bacterium]